MPIIDFIPPRYEAGFSKISSFTDSDFNTLKETLSIASFSASLKDLAKNISELSQIKLSDIKDIFLSVGSILPFIDKEDMRQEVSEDIATIGSDKNLIGDKDIFIVRLKELLNNPQIYYASKARELTTEHANVYINSRIITDIRPVFGMNLDEPPKGGVVTHTLHVHYRAHKEGEHKDIFLALDKDDLEALKNAIERAEKKENNLKNIFEKSGLTNFNE